MFYPVELKIEVLPAEWARAIIDSDWESLEPDEAMRAKAWQIENSLYVIGCGNETIIENFNGRNTECLPYLCVRRH
jgi:hypothetical protein